MFLTAFAKAGPELQIENTDIHRRYKDSSSKGFIFWNSKDNGEHSGQRKVLDVYCDALHFLKIFSIVFPFASSSINLSM